MRRTALASFGSCHSTGVTAFGSNIATLIDALCASNPTKVIPSFMTGSFRMRLWRFERQPAFFGGFAPPMSPFDKATLRQEPVTSRFVPTTLGRAVPLGCFLDAIRSVPAITRVAAMVCPPRAFHRV
jgi:hypothetical protein